MDLDPVATDEDIADLKRLIKTHKTQTGSRNAARILENWNDNLSKFVKVMPRDYKRVLAEKTK